MGYSWDETRLGLHFFKLSPAAEREERRGMNVVENLERLYQQKLRMTAAVRGGDVLYPNADVDADADSESTAGHVVVLVLPKGTEAG
jgi:hypothetical protein